MKIQNFHNFPQKRKKIEKSLKRLALTRNKRFHTACFHQLAISGATKLTKTTQREKCNTQDLKPGKKKKNPSNPVQYIKSPQDIRTMQI